MRGYFREIFPIKRSMKTGKRLIILVIFAGFMGCDRAPRMEASAFEEVFGKPETRTLTEKEITELRDKELAQAVVDNILVDLKNAPGGVTAENVKALNPGQRAIYVTWIMEAKLFKGGFEYFYTKTSETILAGVSEALVTLDAGNYTDLMNRANTINVSLKAGKIKSSDYPFDPLEDAYDDLEKREPLEAIKAKYIRNHPEEFLHE